MLHIDVAGTAGSSQESLGSSSERMLEEPSGLVGTLQELVKALA